MLVEVLQLVPSIHVVCHHVSVISKPSRGTTDSPDRVTVERKLIRGTEDSGRAGSRRGKFGSNEAFWRRCEKRRIRRKQVRTFQRSRQRLHKLKRAPRRQTGSGAPPKSTQKRSTKTSSRDFLVGTFNAQTLKARWKRIEVAAWYAEHGIDILAIQEHSIRIGTPVQPLQTQHLGYGWTFIHSSADAHGSGGRGCVSLV